MAEYAANLRFNRRRFVTGAAAGVALYSAVSEPGTSTSTSAGNDEDVAADPKTDAIVGRLQDIDGAAGTARLQTGDTSVALRLAPEAVLAAGTAGRVPDLDAFLDGDRVAAEGTLHDGLFEASTLASSYEKLEATVEQVDGSTIQAGGMTFDATALFQPASPDVRPLTGLWPGDTISGLFWLNPQTGERILLLGSTGDLTG